MPLISVIVPVYNNSKYLSQCIDCIINQTLSDFELILINDGSTDNSGAICDEYSKKDSRVKVVHQNNRGQASARNKGIRIAKGQWMSFIDSDDVVHPDYLNLLYKAVKNNNAHLSVCGIIEGRNIDDDFFLRKSAEELVFSISDQTMLYLETNYSNSFWLVCGKLIDSNIVRCNLFCEGKIYEDNAVAPKWLYSAKDVVVVNTSLYFYRNNDNGTTRKDFSLKKIDLLWALEEQINFLVKIEYYAMAARQLKLYISSVHYIIANLIKIDCPKRATEVKTNGKHIVKKYKKLGVNNALLRKQIYEFLHPNLSRIGRKIRKTN